MAYTDKTRGMYTEILSGLKNAGLFKQERYIHSAQAADIEVEFPAGAPLKKVINICANNYLGMSSHPEVVKAAHAGLDSHGYGMSSVRFICGTQDIHRTLEQMVTSCAAAEVIVNPLASWVFKTPQNDSFAAIKIFMEMNKLGIAKVAVLVDNSGFGKAGKEQLLKIAPEYKIEIVEAEVYDAKATDLSAVVAKIKANTAVQGVINWSIVPAQSIVVKNIRQAGWQVPIFQSHGFGNIKYVEAAGAAAEGVIFPAGRLLMADLLPDGHPQKSLLIQYIKDYEGKFQEPASTFGGHGYDAFMIFEKAVAVGGNDKEKVRTAIEGLKNMPGTGGVYNFSATDHNGLTLDAFEMMTVKNGKFIPYTGK